MLKAIKPGQIILSISDWVKAKITGREAEFVKEYQVLDDLFGKVRSQLPQNFLVEGHRRADLARIARAMLAHRLGGALLIVPNDQDLSDSLEMRFAVSHFEGFKEDFEKRDSAVGQVEKGRLDVQLDLGELLERAQRSSESIGQLTGIDGATVVTYDLTLLGFGAKIRAKKKELKPDTYVLISKPFERSKQPEPKHIYETPWGTRHKSAAQFVFDHRTALAIVASQDGRLSLFRWDASKKLISVTEDAEFLLL